LLQRFFRPDIIITVDQRARFGRLNVNGDRFGVFDEDDATCAAFISGKSIVTVLPDLRWKSNFTALPPYLDSFSFSRPASVMV
jgi:hypothetical protein